MPRAAPNLNIALRCAMLQSGPKNPSTIPRCVKLIFIRVLKTLFTGGSTKSGGVLFCTLTRNRSSAPFDKAQGDRPRHMSLFQQPVHDSPIWHIEEKLTRFSCQ